MWPIVSTELFQVQCCHLTSSTLTLLNLLTHCMEQSPSAQRTSSLSKLFCTVAVVCVSVCAHTHTHRRVFSDTFRITHHIASNDRVTNE